MEPWPFRDPRNLATFTTWRVIRKADPILTVFHNADDGSWQFLNTIGGQAPDFDDAAIVALEEIVQLDPSVALLADLPRGWHAWRESPEAEWKRTRHDDLGE
jgi:hypothetical protein